MGAARKPDTEIFGTWRNQPNFALAVSLLFTKATNQCIMLGTEPAHVLSTSLLCNSLRHDRRFMPVPLSRDTPGDLVLESGLLPDGFAGIVVDHGRIVSDSRRGVQNNASLVELQSRQPPLLLFRYIGVQRDPDRIAALLANQGYNPEEARRPAGQPGGGQWTTPTIPSRTALLTGRIPRRRTSASLFDRYPRFTNDYHGLSYESNRKPDRPNQVYAEAGGDLRRKHNSGDTDFYDSCALRLSIALNYIDPIPASVPGLKLRSLTTQLWKKEGVGSVDASFILSARDMDTYLTHQWGAPDMTVSIDQGHDTFRTQMLQIQKNLKEGQIAVVTNDGHVSLITPTYNDDDVMKSGASDNHVWILNP